LTGLFIVLGLLISSANAAEKDPKVTDDTAKQDKIVDSLDDAKTALEASAYFNVKRNELLKSLTLTKEREEQLKILKTLHKLTLTASEKIIEVADTEAVRSSAIYQKIAALRSLAQSDSENSAAHTANLNKYLKELSQDEKFNHIVNGEKYNIFLYQQSSELLAKPSIEKFDNFISEIKKWSNTQKDPKPLFEAVALSSRRQLQSIDANLLQKTTDELIAFVKSDESKLSEKQKEEAVAQLGGFSRRSIGADPKIYGKTTDGNDFNWESLRGKYVVVQFTSSWCGPCKFELPGLKEAYEKYHDKGLEIVSIYVWDKLDASKKSIDSENVPWITISEELTKEANLPEHAKVYSIQGIPTTFIVDKEGKIISTDARGSQLQTKLEELFDKNKTEKSKERETL
jgi:thiol-disulfide isomerase/thioredoxin